MSKYGLTLGGSVKFSIKISLVALLIPLAGCAPSNNQVPSTPSTSPSASDSDSPSQSPESVSLRDFELDNAQWNLSEGAGTEKTTKIRLKDGKATAKYSGQYSLGEVLYSDLNLDGVADAAAMLQFVDGKSVHSSLYIWLADGQKPQQLTQPIAEGRNCGTFINEFTAAPGGIKISETRRSLFDDDRSCAEGGTWKVTRTISVEQFGDNETWWPVQVAPKRGYGGVCNESLPGDIVAFDEPYYLAPDKVTKQKFLADEEIRGISIAGKAVTSSKQPEPKGWKLYNVVEKDDTSTRCVWLPIT